MSRGGSRGGLTLLEMMLATVILVSALAALAQQTSTGMSAALRSQVETEAALRCQSQLNRLLCEQHHLRTSPETPFDDDAEWQWSATKSPTDFPGLSLLTVQVSQRGRNRSISSFSLSRLCPDEEAIPNPHWRGAGH